MSHTKSSVLIIFIFLVTACGPSEAEIVQMTQAASTATSVPTATPVPTPTPTPIPIDLTLKIQDTQGNPLAGAEVFFAELEENLLTGADGELSWLDLPFESASFSISAQGFLPKEEAVEVERGSNDATVTLEKDPYGILPADACMAGEELLYVQDFQDGRAQELPDIDAFAGGWSIAGFLDTDDDLAAYYSGNNGTFAVLWDYEFDQAVWRLSAYFEAPPLGMALNWLTAGQVEVEGELVEDSRYQSVFYRFISGRDFSHMVRLQSPVSDVNTFETQNTLSPGEIHLVEISRFEGEVQLWVDGIQWGRYLDPRPIPPGSFGIEIFESETTQSVYFDDIVVCGLSEPFQTMYIDDSVEE